MSDSGAKARNTVLVTQTNVKNASAVEDPRGFRARESKAGDNGLTLASFKRGFRIEVVEESNSEIVFDMIGVDAPLANALRRIMIAEVPTMAIENVTIYQNTSIMQDEVLAHRLGLIPIRADPRRFKYLRECDEEDESNTIVFTLVARCASNPEKDQNAPEDERYIGSVVRSGDLKWIPQGEQEAEFGAGGIAPVYDDIVINKLRPGQVVEAELRAEKGIGGDHIKYSPVGTASYRLLPQVVLKEEIRGAEAEELVGLCSKSNVFDIEDLGGGQKRAVVRAPRNCTMCRNCIRDKKWNDRIRLQRVRNHFIFSVESTGAYKAREIVEEAIAILKAKAVKLAKELDDMYRPGDAKKGMKVSA